MQKSQEKRETFMELTPQILIVVLPLIFLGGFVDSVAGGGGLITLPAYLMAGIPAHLAMGTNKVVNGTGTALASFKYFRGVPPSSRGSARCSARPSAQRSLCSSTRTF